MCRKENEICCLVSCVCRRQGSWSDVVGRRYSLLTCLLFSGFGYSLLGISTSIPLFILARIPVGGYRTSILIQFLLK